MKRPEKIKDAQTFDEFRQMNYDTTKLDIWCEGYNRACSDWESYHDWFLWCFNHAIDNLPDEKEIETIMEKYTFDIGGCGVGIDVEETVKAISKRLRRIST